MIDHFDNLLRHLFEAQIDEITNEAQVRFQPPDDVWRTYVTNLAVNGNPVNALNIYLVDLRENRKLRSNQRLRQVQNGVVNETLVPRRIDCHYLVTAWSPAAVTGAVEPEPAVDESVLLYKATASLMNSEPLIPRQVYEPDPLPGTFPDEFADTELPSTVLPAEGFPKLAEFWGTMGTGYRWKPAVYLVVTLPVVLEKEFEAPLVTTRITEYRQGDRPETAEEWIQIAGTVTDPAGNPVPDAWVGLNPGDQTATTDVRGRFTFIRLRPGVYTLRVRATGYSEVPETIEVPSPGGRYDIQLS